MSCLQQLWEHRKIMIPSNTSKPWNNVCPFAGTSVRQDLHFSSASHFWKLWAACASVWCFMACFRKTLSKSDGLKIKDSAAVTPSALLEAWKKSQLCARISALLSLWYYDRNYSVMELLMSSDWSPASFYCLNQRKTCWNIGSVLFWAADTLMHNKLLSI